MGGEVGGGRTDGAVLSVVLNPGAGGWEPAAPSQVPWGEGGLQGGCAPHFLAPHHQPCWGPGGPRCPEPYFVSWCLPRPPPGTRWLFITPVFLP